MGGIIQAPPDATDLYIEGFLYFSSGIVWFDHFQLLESGEIEIKNYDFEDGFNSWNIWIPDGNPDVMTVLNQHYTGEEAARITGNSSGDRACVWQKVPITGNQSYIVSVWAKGNDILNSTGCRLRIQWKGKNNVHISTHTVQSRGGSFGWTYMSSTIQAPPDATDLYIEGFLYFSSGIVWFDHFQLKTAIKSQQVFNDLKKAIKDQQDLNNTNTIHPYLMLNDTIIQDLKSKQRIEPYNEWYNEVKNEADALKEEAVYTDSSMYETAQEKMKRITCLSLTYLLSDDDTCAERAYREMEHAALDLGDWDSNQFLDCAIMTQALAIGYDWLYEYLDDNQRDVLRTAIRNKGLSRAIEDYNRSAWPDRLNNWNLICNSGIMTGALAVINTESEIATDILEYGISSLYTALPSFAPDGGWFEGGAYWNASMDYFSVFLSSLKTCTGGKTYYILDQKGIAETGYFPIYISGPNKILSFSDCKQDDSFSHPVLFFIADHFSDVKLGSYRKQLLSNDVIKGGVYDLLWYNPAICNYETNLPLDRKFDNIATATFRSEWHDPKSCFIGFSGVKNNLSHAQCDIGSFVLEALGETWAVELGKLNKNDDNKAFIYEYLKDTGGRWQYYRNRAEGHNTIVINPDATADQNFNAKGEIKGYYSEPWGGFAIMDMSDAYIENATSVKRGIKLLRERKQFMVQDEITGCRGDSIYWFMHTKSEIDYLSNADIVLKKGENRLWLKILSPSNALFTFDEAIPVDEELQKIEDNLKDKAITRIKIKLEYFNEENVTICVWMVPLRSGEDLPSQVPGVYPLKYFNISW